jgi:uncharacterized iron-regulated protein
MIARCALVLSLVGCAHRAVLAAPKQPEWSDRAFSADVVYLGEKHDNPEHHQLQAMVLQNLLQRAARPAVVLEMVDEDEQPKLDALANATTPEQYRDGLAWKERGWPDFSMYAPIFRVVIEHRLRVIAGNAPKAAVKKLAFGQGDAAELARYGLDVPLAPGAEKSLEDELAASHCGMLPPESLPAMALAQRARDVALAAHARMAPKPAVGPRAVVIAGAGHVRRDRGAPFYAQNSDPKLIQYSIAFLEGAPDASDRARYDYVWPTSIANAVDHCKDFGKHPAK